MASDGKKRDATSRSEGRRSDRDADLFEPMDTEEGVETERGGVVPDLIRRAMALGFSGFFTTESAIRKALEETLPKEWVDFAADQSERTRAELFDRFATEFGRVMDEIDFVQFAEALLANRTLEINAKIRLGPRDPEGGPSRTELRFDVEDDDRSETTSQSDPTAHDEKSRPARSADRPADREEDDD